MEVRQFFPASINKLSPQLPSLSPYFISIDTGQSPVNGNNFLLSD